MLSIIKCRSMEERILALGDYGSVNRAGGGHMDTNAREGGVSWVKWVNRVRG